ncbi:MAG: V-type ATP synthase subunit F [Oscillospiraceae bacterium]|nr:V-type ATP synthase subunit F [Oscillospiraceae bacterium]
MRCYVLSDNTDTLMGMRLAGIEGTLVHEREELLEALGNAMQKQNIAVVMLTEKLAALCETELTGIKERNTTPLVVVIPDRHGSADMTASISRYLAETVGIHI